MPLYNQQTNLQGQGRFSPGVTYYAGVRAPVPAAPRIEKGQYSFNIDLSPIADAYIDSQKLEASKYEAEADRAFRQGLADQEDKRYRELEAMKDAREREFHADDYNQRQKQLEIDEYKALSNYDIELRKLLREEEKDRKENSTNNDKKLTNSLMNEADIFIRKAYLRTQQDPSYTREMAQDDVYNYVTSLQSNYPEYIDQSKLAETTSRYTFGFGGAKKAAEDSQEKQAAADETQYQTAKESIPGLKNRPDSVARKFYQNAVSQVDSYKKWKSTTKNPYISDEQRQVAFSEMNNSGVNIARLAVLNRIYNFATQPINTRDFTNYYALESALRNETIASLSTMMDYKDAEDYYNIAKERLGVNAFLESYNVAHKTNAEVTNNLTADMLNTTESGYLFTIPQWRSYRALGGNMNALIQTDPRFAANLGQEVLGIVKSNQVQYDEMTKSYSYNNKTYSIEDVIAAERFFRVDNPWAAVMLSAITESKNMSSLVDQGLAEDKDVNETINSNFSLVTKPEQINSDEDVDIVRDNIKSAGFRENLMWCRNRAGAKEGTRFCMTALGLEEQLDDKFLVDSVRALSNTKSSFGKTDSIGYKITKGNGIELGFIDDRINLSDDNFKVLNKYNNLINSRHSNISQDAKIVFLRLFGGLDNIKYCDSSYTGPFITKPTEEQKLVGDVFEADKKISQGYSELSNKTGELMDKVFDKIIRPVKNKGTQNSENSIIKETISEYSKEKESDKWAAENLKTGETYEEFETDSPDIAENIKSLDGRVSVKDYGDGDIAVTLHKNDGSQYFLTISNSSLEDTIKRLRSGEIKLKDFGKLKINE